MSIPKAQHVEEVAIAAIDFRHSLWPVREILRDADLNSLRDDIEANGLRTPIVVRRDPLDPKRYQLVEGRMRIEIAAREGWERIPALVEVMTVDEAVARVMSAEFATWAVRSALERAWMTSEAQRSFGAAGVPSSIRSMSKRWSVGRSTLGNALRIAAVFPKRRVEGFAARLNCTLGDLVDIDQAPLLLIATKPPTERTALATAAFQAHLRGGSSLQAMRTRGATPLSTPRLELGADGTLRVRAGRPISELAPAEMENLAKNCHQVAAELRRRSAQRPANSAYVQRLDAWPFLKRFVEALRARIRGWIRWLALPRGSPLG